MRSNEIRRTAREPSGIRTLGCSSEKRTQDAAGWIYAGELTAQLGAHAACVVGEHIRRLSGSDDNEATCEWSAIFDKVAVLLRAGNEGPLH